MEELNFTSTPDSTSTPAQLIYDPVAAYKFFKAAGSETTLKAGKVIFVQDKKANRLLLQHDMIYLLLEGEVDITVNKKTIATIRKGEIIGEMAFSTGAVRSATATAKTECTVIALNEKQFHAALREKPEFAIMLMGVMAERLRKMITRMVAANDIPASEQWKVSSVFDDDLLAELEEEIGQREIMRFPAGKTILHEGQSGVMMYIVLEGEVSVSIQNQVVERVGPGGMIGEMAIIERTTRLATAVAETDCALLPINRNVFIELVKENPAFCVTLFSEVAERALHIARQYEG
jgi:CRP-like cAMP-binding protein